MKRKVWLAAAIVLCVLAGLRYWQVNANPVCRGVDKEIFVKKGQEVHAPGIDFKILSAKMVKGKENVYLTVKVDLKDHGYYADGKHGIIAAVNNMYFNMPYSLSNPSDLDVVDGKGHKVAIGYLTSKTPQPLTVKFDNVRSWYDQKNAPARFSFLVGDGNGYKKYSLLLE